MTPEPIRYRDRSSGQILEEPVFAESALRFLYGNPLGRVLVWLVLKRPLVSKFYGWLQSRSASRRNIPSFVDRLRIDAGEADRPLNEYRSMNDFFTRQLRPECRPIDCDPRVLVSPADGRTLVFPSLDVRIPMRIKNSQISIAALLADNQTAGLYAGGTAVVFRLAPADYHRFHFPDSGTASPSCEVGSGLHSVHTIALTGGAQSFLNQRMISFLDSPVFGRLALIEVGAMLVGGIRQTFVPGHVDRGAEKGYFYFGASTIVLLIEPGQVRIDDDILKDSLLGLESLVRMGSRIGEAS